MKSLSLILAAGMAAITLTAAGAASAAPRPILVEQGGEDAVPRLIFDLYSPSDPVQLERTQYFWGGRHYCWYDGGWRGPGWYWCGYAYRRGFGWGGPVGFRGWGRGGGGFHGRGFVGHGGGGGFHGGGHAVHGGGGHAVGGHGGGGHGGGGGHHR